ncbi:MAG: hypothetical protein OSA97_17575 [Nevskia sp.]|nr:hypothetical protein [Nevskia sp.]
MSGKVTIIVEMPVETGEALEPDSRADFQNWLIEMAGYVAWIAAKQERCDGSKKLPMTEKSVCVKW